MSVNKSKLLRRSLSARRQLAIPTAYTNDEVESYLIEIDGKDDEGNFILKLHPSTEQTND